MDRRQLLKSFLSLPILGMFKSEAAETIPQMKEFVLEGVEPGTLMRATGSLVSTLSPVEMVELCNQYVPTQYLTEMYATKEMMGDLSADFDPVATTCISTQEII